MSDDLKLLRAIVALWISYGASATSVNVSTAGGMIGLQLWGMAYQEDFVTMAQDRELLVVTSHCETGYTVRPSAKGIFEAIS